MKTKQTIKKLAAAGAFTVAAMTSAFAQANLGASCGCPPVSSRPKVLLSTKADHSSASVEGNLLASTTLDCSKNWVLDEKIYVPSGMLLTIQPGTVVYGRHRSTNDSATALIITRGAMINANGTADCPIVFTAEADPMDGSYPIANNGQWGGILIAGKGVNNLTLNANGPFQAGVGDGRLCVSDGVGTFEGFSSTNSRDQFGAAPANQDNNDNSGTLKYVSIRYSGAILQVGGEINGLSLGSVGHGTTIDHIEVISCADDGMEFWGGDVNVKYYASLFGNDDMFDWDDSYSGKAQFVFGLKTGTDASLDADNGFEMDSDDQKSGLFPRAHPIIFNATMIGNKPDKSAKHSDESGEAAIQAKEFTEGEISNSIFANWKSGLNLQYATGSSTNTVTNVTNTTTANAYDNWVDHVTPRGNAVAGSLKIKCNVFVNCTKDITSDASITSNGRAITTADSTQFFTTDKNVHMASIPGFSSTFTAISTNNTISAKVDATPNPALAVTGCPTPATDGFFNNVSFKGAFDPNGKSNWLSNWSYASIVGGGIAPGINPCVTDLNGDGVTNTTDFLQVIGAFGSTCN